MRDCQGVLSWLFPTTAHLDSPEVFIEAAEVVHGQVIRPSVRFEIADTLKGALCTLWVLCCTEAMGVWNRSR